MAECDTKSQCMSGFSSHPSIEGCFRLEEASTAMLRFHSYKVKPNRADSLNLFEGKGKFDMTSIFLPNYQSKSNRNSLPLTLFLLLFATTLW